MAQDLLSVDGTYYDVAITSVDCEDDITDGENAGRALLSGLMIRDIIGTFTSYTVGLEVKGTNYTELDSLRQVLRQPVPSHSLTVVDDQGTVTFDAYISKVKRSLKFRTRTGAKRWGGMTVTFTPMAPQLTP